ncbi:MAG TPA: hypothetical protein VFZ34_32445 [Blastocatellia bacterium]|nr:hypothetical protein [Blastocatellia bacterium]
MNKPKLIKRDEVAPKPAQKPIPTAVALQKTVNDVKGWLNTRHQNTKQSAREAFAQLFAQPSCTEC